MAMRRSKKESKLLRYAILGSWFIVCVFPILWFLSIGLRPRTEIITPEPIYWPTLSLDAWHMIWNDWPMFNYLRNSVLAIFGSVLIDLVLAIPAAYSLARYSYRGRDDIGFYILSTRMMAPAIVAVPIFFLFKNMGQGKLAAFYSFCSGGFGRGLCVFCLPVESSLVSGNFVGINVGLSGWNVFLK